MNLKKGNTIPTIILMLFAAFLLFAAVGCDGGCGSGSNGGETQDPTVPDTPTGNNDDEDPAIDDGCILNCASEPAADCTSPQVRITEVDLGVTVVNNESETELKPIALAAIPSGGSWLAWMGSNGRVYMARLDCNDRLATAPVSFPANDFQDIISSDEGGALLLTRNADGGGTLNCGNPSNLCDGGPNPPISCYGMYTVGFDCAGKELWATQLTTQNRRLPPYSTGPNGPEVHMIWWYQHHGRLAWDGDNFAAYFGEALSVSQGGCINIHQGDRMQVVDSNGTLLAGHDSVDWGCSHSWNTRMVWDPSTGRFEMVCATDRTGGIAQPANPGRLIYRAKNLSTLSIGDITTAAGGGYWITASDQGNVLLMRLRNGSVGQTNTIGSSPHSKLAAYDSGLMVAGWGSGSTIAAVVLDASDGSFVSDRFNIDVPNNIYHPFKAYPDGSVAYAAPGSNRTSIRIARILPCTR